ncbi:hypothetical protein GCM10009557_38460 [Virgisporangium ochraceum]|uniref:Uncharacterized protein n=1 Tax=Virgisporangium ochraceum TaxID=65505 RepID=A0A8J3ZUM5_9ACTN|nr:hypothetical protein [Virgisporangium ochraceum]GIJ70214.1 hypothetical protein Voc01_051310 [Virgisporangium ochraceum]
MALDTANHDEASASSLPPDRPNRGIADIVALVVGLVSGTAGLAGLSAGTNRRLLFLLCIALLFFVVVRFWHRYYVARNRRLRQQLAAANKRQRQYVEALVRTMDWETSLFRDRIKITIHIGQVDAEDRVVEEWHTTPKPQLTHRAYRPIIPTDDERVVRLAEIGFTCGLTDQAGKITVLPLVEKARYLRVWLMFEPAWRTPVDWVSTYQPVGLWKRLRDTGTDRLGWQDRLPTMNNGASSLDNIEIHFIFPPSTRKPGLVERQGWGSTSDPEPTPSGHWRIVWNDPNPAGRQYNWELTQQRD